MYNTIYEACNSKGNVLYDGVSLADLRVQIVKASEDEYMSAPDIVEIRGTSEGVDFELSEKMVKEFNDSLEEVCDFKFWEDEDTTKDWREM